jgi:hypothetical protein
LAAMSSEFCCNGGGRYQEGEWYCKYWAVGEREGTWPNRSGRYWSLLNFCTFDASKVVLINLDTPLTTWNFNITLSLYSYVISFPWLSIIAGFGV